MPGYAELSRDIKEDKIRSLYLFFGEEAYLRDHSLAQIQAKLLPEGAECFNLHKLPGKGLTLRALADVCESIPFPSGKKLVIAEDFDLMGIPATDRDVWVDFLQDVPEYCCLIFVYNTLTYKPDGRSKIQAALNKHAVIVEFAAQEDAKLIGWMLKRFAPAAVDRNLCAYLIFRCGHGMTTLLNEIEKILAYTDGRPVTRELVDEVTEPVLDAVVFDMTDAVAAGDTKRAAGLLQTLQWMREPPEALLGALGKTIRGLYAARLALDEKKSARQLMEVCAYRSTYPAEKLLRSARRVTLAWCRNALSCCREADAALKGGAGDGRERVMEWLLAKIA